MTADQRRGVAIYAAAAVLLLAGGFWWVRAAPDEAGEPGVAQYRATAEELLPDVESQVVGATEILQGGSEQVLETDAGIGRFVVSMVCVGPAESIVRVMFGVPGSDSGRRLSCNEEISQETFPVSLAGELRLRVAVGENGPVVFRYAVIPND